MSLKILLADDSMTAQNMGKKILVDAGYDVVAVSNGAAAIKKIASDRPDIIILDVYMPGYTGLEVCERVKGANETARTPVLLTVGKMEPFKPEEANRVRADGVMIKPFEATDLIAAIQSIANKMTTTAAPLHDTVRIASPTHEDTNRPAPKGTQSHPAYEETLRLTPEQVRAFQDKSYKEGSAEVDAGEKPAAEAVPEITVSPVRTEEPEPTTLEPLIAPAASILEPVESAVAAELAPATPIMPGLDSSESHIARAMAGAMAGHDFFTVTPPAHHTTHEAEAQEAPALYIGSEETAPVAPSQPFFTLQQHAEPEPIEMVAETASVMNAAPTLETSAPVVPGPAFVAQLEELEPNVAPPVFVVAEAAPELEVNSPIHLQPTVEVTTDPALISSDDDMSQFVTKFGQDNAEQVHVGVASDLPPEQLAALTMPQFKTTDPEIMQEVPVLESPEAVVSPMVELDVPEPVGQEASVFLVEPEAPVDEGPVAKFYTNVLDQVGTIEPDAASSGSGPMVAYVPTLDDTQPIPPYVETEPVIAPESVLLAAAVEPAPVAEPEPVVEASAAEAFAPAVEEFRHEAPVQAVVESAISVELEEPVHGPVGDAVLAEELAAALDEKEVEECAAAAAEPVEGHGGTDNKLSEAVSRAIEKLRPQLIAEILKEMTK